jgi:ubiquinone/menaquinone biosynthesis C-methylase UbiE
MWDTEPELPALLASLGHMKGRAVLVLGNGFSLKELYFLILGAHCVISDLAFGAIERSKELFESSELSGTYCREIEYHAVDALNLPFADQSFDIIYGYAFVHHLEDLDRFFSEVARCLRPGGICRFLDDGFSPIWQFVKKTVLRPLQIYSHWKTGISPEDLAATRKGGYTRDEAREIMEKHGFNNMIFVRKYFFEYLLRRGSEKLGGKFMLPIRPLLRALDELLERKTGFMEAHGLRLIWGFNKPDTGSL